MNTTLGFRPTCDCREERLLETPVNAYVQERVPDSSPAIVLDPFCGSGTTLLVARQLGLHGIGFDLSYPYLRDQARTRLNLDKLDQWHNGILAPDTDLSDLPLFQG